MWNMLSRQTLHRHVDSVTCSWLESQHRPRLSIKWTETLFWRLRRRWNTFFVVIMLVPLVACQLQDRHWPDWGVLVDSPRHPRDITTCKVNMMWRDVMWRDVTWFWRDVTWCYVMWVWWSWTPSHVQILRLIWQDKMDRINVVIVISHCLPLGLTT